MLIKLWLIHNYVTIKLQLIHNCVTIELQLIHNNVTIALRLMHNYFMIKLQLLPNTQHTSIIADELIPVTMIQTYDSLHYSTLLYITIKWQLNYYFTITTCSVFESMEPVT